MFKHHLVIEKHESVIVKKNMKFRTESDIFIFILSLMAVGCSKTILHTQQIKIFRIVTSINIFNLCDNLKCFNCLCVQIYFGPSTYHH